MVSLSHSYDRMILLARARAFHFSGPLPPDFLSDKYLHGDNPDDVVCAVLAHAQRGDFSPMSRLIEIMKTSDDGVIWGRCCMLLSYAAPFSVLRDLIAVFSDALYEGDDIVTQQWICETLCKSGALWCVPEVLKIFRRNTQRNQYFSVPRYLSFILENEREAISEGPPVLPRTDDLPPWFDVPVVYDDDAFERLVMDRHATLCGQSQDPDHAAVIEGELLSMTRVATKALERIRACQDVEEIAIARCQLEAATGEDLSAFYRDHLLSPLSAAACVERLLETGRLDQFELGRRYFFGRMIPD